MIDVRALHVLEELGGGRRGAVRRVAVPDPAAPVMAYLEYRSEVRADVRWPVLEALIDLPGEVDGATRAWFAEHTAWPSRLVTRDGEPVGFLMPLAPPTRLADLAGALDQRLLVLRDLAAGLERLHGLGIQVGDLSRVAVELPLASARSERQRAPQSRANTPLPRAILLNCDGVRRGDQAVLPTAEAPEDDVRQLGLIALRLITGGQDAGALGAIAAELVDVARRSLDPGTAPRPAAAEWRAALDRIVTNPAPEPATITAPLADDGPPSGFFGVIAEPDWSSAPPPPPPRRRGGGRSGLVAVLVAALVASCGGFYAYAKLTSPDRDVTTAPPTYVEPTDEEPETAPAPSPAATTTTTGTVDYAPVAGDSRAFAVGEFLDRYFAAVNRHDIDTVLRLYDPASSVGRADAAGRSKFAEDFSTTTDTGARIERLEPGTNGASVSVTVTFQSTQQPGFGPARDPAETCTLWQVTWALSEPSPGDYRILRGSGTSQPC